jgi:hypothetical protein
LIFKLFVAYDDNALDEVTLYQKNDSTSSSAAASRYFNAGEAVQMCNCPQGDQNLRFSWYFIVGEEC